MPEFFNSFVRSKARKLAELHVKQALDMLRYNGQFSFDGFQKEIDNNYWNRKNINCVFERAYDHPWYTLGHDDATKGLKRFAVPAYEKGWRDQVLSLSYNGWINARIVNCHGWIDETISQQLSNIKRDLDLLDWESALHMPKQDTE